MNIQGNKRFEVIGGKRSAIVTNGHDGAYVTILCGRKVESFAQYLCESWIDQDFLQFILENCCAGSEAAMVEWLRDTPQDTVESQHLMYTLSKEPERNVK